MKRSIFMFLVIGATMIFFCCSENNSTAPELSQGDQVTTTLAKTKTPFTDGTADIVKPYLNWGVKKVLPNGIELVKGIKVRYDMEVKSESYLTGALMWDVNKKKINKKTTKLWGKIELFVGVKKGDDGYEKANGKWEITFHGWRHIFDVVLEAVGVGKEGSVKGMVGKWTFYMHSNPFIITDPPYPYSKEFHLIEGYISK